MNKSTLISVLCIGIAIGACAREEDLNEFAAEGWRYVGPLPSGNGNPALVFER